MAGVDTLHSEYIATMPDWKLCRDTSNGERAVVTSSIVASDATGSIKGTYAYVPRLEGQDDQQYANYIKRGSFYGAMGRSVDGLTGLLFRKKPTLVNENSLLESWKKDVTNRNNGLNVFAQSVVDDLMVTGRVGILVDFTENTEGLSKAEAEEFGSRPFFTMYKAEQIINWQQKYIRGYGFVLSRVVLKEVYEYQNGTDVYDLEETDQYRELYLDESGFYKQRIFRENSEGGLTSSSLEFEPKMNGKRIPFIPFVFINQTDNTSDVKQPPLLSLAQVNIKHFMVDVDRSHVEHLLGLATVWTSGVDAEGAPSTLGPGQIWHLPKDATANVLQIDGSGTEVLAKRQEQFEQQMARLGARMLAPERAGVEAAETLSLRNQGEYSVMTSIAMSVSQGITTAIKWAAMWMGMSDDQVNMLSFKISTDFSISRLTAQDLTALIAAWQGDAISYETLIENLKQGEIVRDDKTPEEERELIADGGGSIPSGTGI